jgi:phosphatidate cytidylyltransferase
LNDFYKRTLTGAGIVIFILGGYWLHPVSFFLTGLILLTGCLYEYYMMIRRNGISPQLIPGMITGVSLYVISTLVASETISGKFFLLLIPISVFIMIAELYRRQDKPADNIAHTFLPVIYAAIPFSMIPFSAFSHTGLNSLLPVGNTVFSPGVIIGFFLLIWANDTGAYLTGRAFGKHKLMERISPKKTWEGFFGGMIIAAVIAWLLSDLLGVVDSMKWMTIAVIVSITGTLGDLVESMLKRSTGVKDSGKILPGHGGFLDRFDSTIISFPLVYLFLTLFG